MLLNLPRGQWHVSRLTPGDAESRGFQSCWGGAGMGLGKQQRADYSAMMTAY